MNSTKLSELHDIKLLSIYYTSEESFPNLSRLTNHGKITDRNFGIHDRQRQNPLSRESACCA